MIDFDWITPVSRNIVAQYVGSAVSRVSGHPRIGIDLAVCITGVLVTHPCFPRPPNYPENPSNLKPYLL